MASVVNAGWCVRSAPYAQYAQYVRSVPYVQYGQNRSGPDFDRQGPSASYNCVTVVHRSSDRPSIPATVDDLALSG